jgi:transcriptional regulator with XRE-family HTH domain
MPLDPEKIKARRIALGLSQAEAAAMAGIQRSSWARIEAGDRDDPALSTAERMAHALRVGLAKILRE